jgi:hypothetical protein
MSGSIENKVVIREYNEDRDIKVVGKLERKCEIGSNKEVSIFTNMMGDPLSRIRFYPVHVMLVGELQLRILSFHYQLSPNQIIRNMILLTYSEILIICLSSNFLYN